MAGVAIGTGGTVYVEGSDGSVTSLAPKSLAVTGAFDGGGKTAAHATPVVFTYKDREMLVAGGADGRLSLLDPAQLSKAVFQTPPVGVVWGGLSSWLDSDGTRWIAAPVWGPVNAQLKFGIANGAAASGSIIAFKVEEPNGVPVLTPAWVSRNLDSPEPPVIASGIVFVLAAGEHDKGESRSTALMQRYTRSTRLPVTRCTRRRNKSRTRPT